MGMDGAQSHRRRIRRDEISAAFVLGRPLPVSGARFPVRGCKTVDEGGWTTCSRRFLEDFPDGAGSMDCMQTDADFDAYVVCFLQFLAIFQSVNRPHRQDKSETSRHVAYHAAFTSCHYAKLVLWFYDVSWY